MPSKSDPKMGLKSIKNRAEIEKLIDRYTAFMKDFVEEGRKVFRPETVE